MGSIAHAQIDSENGYQCNAGDFVLTNNLSLIIDETNPTCTTPVETAQWFDLSADPTFAGQYATLKCVDFSMWGTNNTADQLITVRVFQDLTAGSHIGCDSQVAGYDGANEPGPDLAGALLLSEEETFIPVGVDPPSGPRLDGDFSVEFPGPQGGGILLDPDIAFLSLSPMPVKQKPNTGGIRMVKLVTPLSVRPAVRLAAPNKPGSDRSIAQSEAGRAIKPAIGRRRSCIIRTIWTSSCRCTSICMIPGALLSIVLVVVRT